MINLYSLTECLDMRRIFFSFVNFLWWTVNLLPFRQTPRVTADDNHGTVSNNVPLPESTSGLEWSSLVSVATKAIEGICSSHFLYSI